VTTSSCCGRSPRSDRSAPMRRRRVIGVVIAGACGRRRSFRHRPRRSVSTAWARWTSGRDRADAAAALSHRRQRWRSRGTGGDRQRREPRAGDGPRRAGSDSVLVAAPDAGAENTVPAGRLRGRVVQTLVECAREFSAASLPAITLHIAGDVYGEAECRATPPDLGSPSRYPAPLLLSRSAAGRLEA